MRAHASVLGSVAAVLALVASRPAVAQSTTRVSVNSAGVPADQSADDPMVSWDGRWIAFSSSAGNLGGGEDLLWDVFVHDRASGITSLASVDSSGIKANGSSWQPALSGAGSHLAFASYASNLDPNDTQTQSDVFVRDLGAGATQCVSLATGGGSSSGYNYAPSISFDGRYVVWTSTASDLVAGDFNSRDDVFLRDRLLGTTELVSVASSGAQGDQDSGWMFLSADRPNLQVSQDGRYVVFESRATNLVPGDTNGTADAFVRDRALATTVRVSVDSNGAQVPNGCLYAASCLTPAISRDGRFVAFASNAAGLVLGDTNGVTDIFVHELATGATERVSLDSSGVECHGHSAHPALSDDGRFVVFDSFASDLVAGDTNGVLDVFSRDRLHGATARVSMSSTGAQADAFVEWPTVSGDGRFTVFTGTATTLVAGGSDSFWWDVFLHDSSELVVVERYCTAKVNSAGCVPEISSAGLPSAAGYDSFFLVAVDVLPQKSGVFFWGTSPASIPFGGGTLCVQPPLVRSFVLGSGGNGQPTCDGAYSFEFRQSYMQQKGLQAGDTVLGQFWSRDPGFAPPNNIGLSDGIRFTIAP